MGSTRVFSVTVFLNLSIQNPRYFVQCRDGLETSVLIRQHLNGCQFVPYLVKITGAKFEHYLSNILNILNFVIYYSHAFSL